jgi:hypothetical protein
MHCDNFGRNKVQESYIYTSPLQMNALVLSVIPVLTTSLPSSEPHKLRSQREELIEVLERNITGTRNITVDIIMGTTIFALEHPYLSRGLDVVVPDFKFHVSYV